MQPSDTYIDSGHQSEIGLIHARVHVYFHLQIVGINLPGTRIYHYIFCLQLCCAQTGQIGVNIKCHSPA